MNTTYMSKQMGIVRIEFLQKINVDFCQSDRRTESDAIYTGGPKKINMANIVSCRKGILETLEKRTDRGAIKRNREG